MPKVETEAEKACKELRKIVDDHGLTDVVRMLCSITHDMADEIRFPEAGDFSIRTVAHLAYMDMEKCAKILGKAAYDNYEIAEYWEKL